MVYWFIGQPGAGKTTLAGKLKGYLESIKTSSEDIFHIDGDELRELFPNRDYSKEGRQQNIKMAFSIAKYLNSKGNDVIISLISPYLELREIFKSEVGIVEIYCHTNVERGRENYFVEDFAPPRDNFIDLDKTQELNTTFLNLVNLLSCGTKIRNGSL